MSYERLTSRNDFQGQCSHCRYIPALDEYGCWNDTEKRFMLCNKCEHKERYDKLKEFEDKIESGTLVGLPCKVGDTVFIIAKQSMDIYTVEETTIVDFWFSPTDNRFYPIDVNELPIEKVFLTKAEAEEKLRELIGEKE